MSSSGMLRRIALVRIDASEELSASIISVIRIGELGTTLAVISNRRTLRRLLVTVNVVPISPILVTLMMEALSSSETSVLTRATARHIREDDILHSHRLENLKSYSINWLCSVAETLCVSCEVQTRFLYPREGLLLSHRSENSKSSRNLLDLLNFLLRSLPFTK
jgi:hypothetical protein